jgi:type I restriction enzyme, S subunit
MIHNLKPYPRYKESGLPWLRKVPEHWEIKRGKNLFQPIDIRSSTGEEELLTVSSNRGVIPRKSANVTMFKAESYLGYKLCWPGDLVINSLWAWAGGLGVSSRHGIVSSAYGVYRLRSAAKNNPMFFHALVRSIPFQWELQVRSKGIWTSRLQLTDESFLGAPFPLPSAEEQSAIVRYLSYMDRRIGRYIQAKQKMIKLLNEQKEMIIHDAVTHSLGPVIRLKYVAAIQTGITLGKNYVGQHLQQRPYLRVANVQSNRLDLKIVKTIAVPTSEIAVSELKYGDVLMTEGGDIDKLGRGCLWRDEIQGCLHQNHIFAVRPKSSYLLPEYLVVLTTSPYGRTYFQITAKKTTNLASTNSTTIGEFPFALPDLDEQNQILKRISDRVQSIDGAIRDTADQISLLREHRTRLVADVVTGKIDVREDAARLPDEAEEFEITADEELLINENQEPEQMDDDECMEEAEG